MRSVRGIRVTLWRWTPPIIWMALISAGSTDSLASDETSRFIVPFLRWLVPGATSATLDLLHEAIRKLGHIGEFAVLALLWFRTLTWERRTRTANPVLAACLLSVAFAGLDEAHQAFVATRNGSLWDVGWDSLGAVIGAVGGHALWGMTGAATARDTVKIAAPRS